MLEALLVLALFLSIKFLPLWAAIAVFITVLPGMYAMLTGAPFVPTPEKIVRSMVAFAAIKPGEKVYDLGCGDGRLVFAAADRGARATGFELSIPTYLLAKIRSLFHAHSSIRYADFWRQDLSDADVVFCFLVISTMQRFKAEIWPTLKPGCRVVSHAFHMQGISVAAEKDGAILYVK